MEWYVLVAAILLTCLVFLLYRSRISRAGSPTAFRSRAEPARTQAVTPVEPAAPEPQPEAPPAPGQLRATLQVELRGRPGNFAMRWEPLATYQLFMEVSDRRTGTQSRHDLAEGELFYWQGGAQRSMHDAGYALPQEDVPAIKHTMLAHLETLRQEGWDVMETSAWVRETMGPPDIGIRVRDAKTPYDQSPQPGTHQRHIVDTEMQRCPD